MQIEYEISEQDFSECAPVGSQKLTEAFCALEPLVAAFMGHPVAGVSDERGCKRGFLAMHNPRARILPIIYFSAAVESTWFSQNICKHSFNARQTFR
jgi:hypothetical protein